MYFLHDKWCVRELKAAARRVREIHLQIECQRQLIEELVQDGYDYTSAKIVFDSLQISLSLSLQDRHRLSAMQSVESADVNAT